MGICKDPVTEEFNKRGYNLVKLPRIGIEPMDVLGRDGDSMEKLGSIDEVWSSAVPLPAVSAPAPTAGIEGSKTSDLDIGIGLKLLGNALAGLGGGISLPSLTTAFKRARKLQFTFANVESTGVTPFALGKFLANGSLDMTNPFSGHYFGNDETEEYVIFEVLKSNALSVTAKTDSGVVVDADIGALNGALSTNVKAQVGGSGTSEVTFIGTAKVTFAFKLFEVLFENGRWTPRGIAADPGLSFMVGDDEDHATVTGAVLAPGRMLKVKL